MTTGLEAVRSRIDQLQALVTGAGVASGPLGSASGTVSGTGFAASLGSALTGPGDGTPGGGSAAVTTARQYLGVRYRWGGTDPSTGLDCSGLVQLVYRRLGVALPRTSQQQEHSGTEVASLAQAQPGDLIFFGEPAHHVGIYVGDGKMIDAPHTGSTVGVHAIAGYGTVSHIRRILPPSAGTSASGLSASGLSASGLSASGLSASGLSASGLSAAATPGTTSSGRLDGPYAGLFTAAGRRYGVDPALLSAVARAESSYDPHAVSSAGAQGLMQLMPGTARSLAVDPFDPAQAVDGAARLLSSSLRAYSGRVDLALAAYNAGPGAVRRYGGVPPYAQTQTYVHKVMSYWEALR